MKMVYLRERARARARARGGGLPWAPNDSDLSDIFLVRLIRVFSIKVHSEAVTIP
jgi:hypothetical protein